MDKTVFTTKFNIKDKNYYVRTEWKDNDNDLFRIKIYDGDHCWVGRFSNEFAEKFRGRVDESPEEYKSCVKTGVTKNTDEFVYEFCSNSDFAESATFSWKKRYEGEILILHGSVPVHQDNSIANKNSLVDILLQENKDLKQLLEDCDMNIQMLNVELETSKTELEKFMNVKTSLEMSVYGKFIQLLNSKKKRIQMLEQNLQDLQMPNNFLIDTEVD